MPRGDILDLPFPGSSGATFHDVISGALSGGPDGDLLTGAEVMGRPTLPQDAISGKFLQSINEVFLPRSERYLGSLLWTQYQQIEAYLEKEDYVRRVRLGQRPDPNLCRRCRRFCLIRNGLFTNNQKIRFRPFGTWCQLLFRTHCRICRLILFAGSCGTNSLHPRLAIIQPELQFLQLHPKCLASGEQAIALEFGLRYIGLLRIVTKDNFREVLRQAYEIGDASPFDSIFDQSSAFNNRDGQVASIQTINDWIRRCEREHGPMCKTVWRQLPENKAFSTLLIDVVDRCLVMKPITEVRYFTLSYVWGNVIIPETTKDNLRARLIRGSLNCHLPTTIEHAIVLVRNLGPGERYLWVDSLCIVQDDKQSKHDEIQAMDMIYSHAVATIIALSGSNADVGLPGVLPGTREPQWIEHRASKNNLPSLTARQIQELDRLAREDPDKHKLYLSSTMVANKLVDTASVMQRLADEDPEADLLPPESNPVHANNGMVAHPPSLKHMLSLSVWNKRSWTLQERLLSRRCIFFTPQNVYFQCGEATWSEIGGNLHTWNDVEDEESSDHSNLNEASPQRETNPLLHFRRPAPTQSVSYDTEDGSGHLLRQDIDTYMSIVDMYSKRRLTFTTDVLNAITGILSVAQARLGGQMLAGLPSTYLDLAIMWTPAEPMDRTTPVGRGGNKFPSWSWSSWTGGKQYRLAETGRASYHSLQHEYATSEIANFYILNQGKAIEIFKSPEDMLASELRNFDRIHNREFERLHPKYVAYTDRTFSNVKGPDFGPGVLQFWAQVVPESAFTVENGRDTLITDPEHGNISGRAHVSPLLDRAGEQCGLLFLPQAVTNYRAGVSSGKPEFLLMSSFRDTTQRRGGIQTMDTRLKPFDERVYPWKDKGSGLCNVMLVEWFDEIAERVSVAQIHRGAWEAAKPRRRHIRLS